MTPVGRWSQNFIFSKYQSQLKQKNPPLGPILAINSSAGLTMYIYIYVIYQCFMNFWESEDELQMYEQYFLGGGFKYFFIFTPIWGRFPFWLIFFRWVETTNQISSTLITPRFEDLISCWSFRWISLEGWMRAIRLAAQRDLHVFSCFSNERIPL